MRVNANAPADQQARSDNPSNAANNAANNARPRAAREAVPGAVQSQVQDKVDLSTGEVTRAPPNRTFQDLGNEAGKFFSAIGSRTQDFFSRVGAGNEQALTSLFNYTGNIGRAAVDARVDTLTRGAGARLGATTTTAASRPAGGYLGNMTLARAFGGIGDSAPSATPSRAAGSAARAAPAAAADAQAPIHLTSAQRGAGSSTMGQPPPAAEAGPSGGRVGPRAGATPPGVVNFAEETTVIPGTRASYRIDDGYTNNYRGKGYEAIVLHGKATPSGQASYLQYQRGKQVVEETGDPNQPPQILQPFTEVSNVSARQLVQKINKNHGIDLVGASRGGKGPDTPLYLLACHSTRGGCASSAAQGMANYTGREVRAYSDYVIEASNPSLLHGNRNYRVEAGQPEPGLAAPPGTFMPAAQRALLRARNTLAGHGPTLALPHKSFYPQPGSTTEQDIVRPTVAPPPSLASTSMGSRAQGSESPTTSFGSVPAQSSSYSSVQYYPPTTHPLVTLPGSRPQSSMLGYSGASEASRDTPSSEYRLPGEASSSPSGSTGSFTPSPPDSPHLAYRRPGVKRATSS